MEGSPKGIFFKKCTRCKEIKDISEFCSDKTRRFGISGRCQICEAKFYREKVARNRQNYRNKAKRYYNSHKEEIIKRRKLYNKQNPIKTKARQLLKTALTKGILERKPGDR